jgi:GntR family transcriptional regulator
MKRFVEGADRRPARLEFWLVVALGGYDEPINRSGQRKEDGPGYSQIPRVGPMKSPPKPRYSVIADEVARAIERGQYPIGTLLPSEAGLRAQYDVSHHTVREAMRRLQELRLVTPEQGRGTRVVARSAVERYVHSLEAIPDLGEVVRNTRIKVLRRARIRRSEAESKLPDHSDEWFLIEAVRSTATHPLVWKQVYIDARYAKAALKVGTSNTPVYRLIERLYGEKLLTVRQEVGATPIASAIAAVLAVKSGSPGLLIERKYVSESGRIFEVTRSIYPAGRFRYSSELHLDRRA